MAKKKPSVDVNMLTCGDESSMEELNDVPSDGGAGKSDCSDDDLLDITERKIAETTQWRASTGKLGGQQKTYSEHSDEETVEILEDPEARFESSDEDTVEVVRAGEKGVRQEAGCASYYSHRPRVKQT